MKIRPYPFVVLAAFPLALTACGDSADTKEPSATQAIDISAAPNQIPVATVEVANSSENALTNQALSFSLNTLGATAPVHAAAKPSQLVDDDGDGKDDRLIVLADLAAASTEDIKIVNGAPTVDMPARTHAEISIKTGGSWVDGVYVGGEFSSVQYAENPAPKTDHQQYFRYEGPGIESDEIGYRVYLDHRNGFDIFGKKSADMVLRGVGLDGYDSYHEMADWGADILKVGSSLGAGGYGYWNGTSVETVSDIETLSARILASGPIYSAVQLNHGGWSHSGGTVDISSTLSMVPGSPFVDVDLKTSAPMENIAIGLVKHPETELLQGTLDVTGEAWSYVASYGKQTLFEDNLGMALLFRKMDLEEVTEDENSYVLVMDPRGTELSYAFGAFWEGGNLGSASRDEFEAMLMETVRNRTIPARVSLTTSASDDLAEMSGLEISTELVRSEIDRRGNGLHYGEWDTVRRREAAWTYTTGLLMEAFDDVASATNEPAINDYVTSVMDSYLAEDGTIRDYSPEEYNIDHINPGKILQRLRDQTGTGKYDVAIAELAAQLTTHPRTSQGAYWHKKKYPHQLWLDGVYMGMPFLAGVGVVDGDQTKLEAAVHEFEIAREHLRDPETGLYFHAWDEAKQQIWADPDTGQSKYVWGRGLGWYAMALVDILDVIPTEEVELRQRIIYIAQELAVTLLEYQDASGVWYQIMDMPTATGNYLESSGSAMFVYFLAKGVNDGHLDESYRAIAQHAYKGYVTEFITRDADGNVNVNNMCEVAGLGFGRDGSYDYYMSERVVRNDPKGLGPAIKAGVQVAKLSN